eukprot:CAMPEP_0167828766 /NCGR_PEP_ID=MMETSP0112_2-20121227/11670_1 /TAXON_ID=91324 /ORGANISM="Lotharella globosa, Strain CCCM811" /LENGTH=904 /DNA_ID=CAMNT_0007732153 /DNA_START=111 /DNA_END=2825 /DNA_ORIENTATION=-
MLPSSNALSLIAAFGASVLLAQIFFSAPPQLRSAAAPGPHVSMRAQTPVTPGCPGVQKRVVSLETTQFPIRRASSGSSPFRSSRTRVVPGGRARQLLKPRATVVEEAVVSKDTALCIPLDLLNNNDVEYVGGKSASLGEMISGLASADVPVPGGFSTTAHAYRQFLAQDGLDEEINALLDDPEIYTDVTKLQATGKYIREKILTMPFSPELEASILENWERVSEGNPNAAFAVRSSATAEDLPDASFAGQQETYLNVRGREELFAKIKEVFASLFTDRAISYRHDRDFDHNKVALAATIQQMVRSETGSSGVMFSLDTETGFRDVVFVTSAWGLGETVVGGTVNPDEFYVFKPTLEQGKKAVVGRNLGSKMVKMVYAKGGGSEIVETDERERTQWSVTDDEVLELSKMATAIEKHYGFPVDVEWAKDGDTGKLYIVQARPETVASRKKANVKEEFKLKERGSSLVEGRAVGARIGAGTVRILSDASQMAEFKEGEVLVADMTDPDWEPIMKKAAAIVTNRGGRTCHAAIIARELGIPAVVGTADATDKLKDGDEVTVVCSEGDTGVVYAGQLDYERKVEDLTDLPDIPVKLMLNLANPSRAFEYGQLPNAGIGLARLEFVINNVIGIHPRALLGFDKLPQDLRNTILEKTKGYPDPVSFYVDKIAEGVGTLAASVYPRRIIVRLSDFKSNEYKSLLGGPLFEPDEENPMIGFRGAGRYTDESFRECFELELLAMKKVREEMGLTNVELMIPFVRTLEMAQEVNDVLESNGLKRGDNGLKVQMMAELPSNVFLADEFLDYFDGFSIGSNDLTQLTLGLDRDSGLVAKHFDERNPAVKKALAHIIQTAKARGKYVGICGQGPSDFPDFAQWLVEQGIDSLSLNPDSVVPTWMHLSDTAAAAKSDAK